MLIALICTWLFAFGVILVICFNGMMKRNNADQVRNCDQALQKHVIVNSDPRFAFNPSTAVLIRDQPDIVRGRIVGLNRIYRNGSGEYFLFVWGGLGQDYFIHLSRERAVNALRTDIEIFRKEFPEEFNA